jgi:hypothetical protein
MECESLLSLLPTKLASCARQMFLVTNTSFLAPNVCKQACTVKSESKLSHSKIARTHLSAIPNRTPGGSASTEVSRTKTAKQRERSVVIASEGEAAAKQQAARH